MGLRLQDPVPEWISHIALVHDGRVQTGEKTTMLQELNDSRAKASHSTSPVHNPSLEAKAKVLVNMQNVNVRYHERHVRHLSSYTQFIINSVQVLKDVNWNIRSGDRWHLQGANGEFLTENLTACLRPC
jgi:ATPase subunit of ABC transporter with duplicated ATPase domains